PRGRRARGDRARVPGRHGDPPSPRGAGVTQAPVQTPRLFRATDPRTGAFVGPEFAVTTPEELDGAVAAAVRAFPRFAAFPPEARARFLRRAAEELRADEEEVVAVAAAETALPEARLRSELARTTGQLEMFAALGEGRQWRDARVHTRDPGRQAAPPPAGGPLRP